MKTRLRAGASGKKEICQQEKAATVRKAKNPKLSRSLTRLTVTTEGELVATQVGGLAGRTHTVGAVALAGETTEGRKGGKGE